MQVNQYKGLTVPEVLKFCETYSSFMEYMPHEREVDGFPRWYVMALANSVIGAEFRAYVKKVVV